MKLKLYNPTKPQLEALEISRDEMPYITFMAYGRQTGKTYHMMMDMLDRALTLDQKLPANKKRIMWISPIMQQATKVFEAIESLFVEHQEVWDMIIKRFDRKHTMIQLFNGAVIQFASADQGDNLRGDTIVHTYIDEVAFMDLEFIQKVVMPMHTRTKGRMTWGSTFNGKNWAWDKYNDGQKEANKDSIISLKRTYKDLNDPEVTATVMQIKQSMSKAAFAQEYLCEPVTMGAVFSNVKECSYDTYPDPDSYEKVFLGMDIGVKSDYTVLVAMNEKYEVVGEIERFNMMEENISSDEYKQKIVDFYNKWDAQKIKEVHGHRIEMGSKLVAGHFEVNNQTLLYEELFDDFGLEALIPVAVHGKNKSEMVENAIKLFEEKAIKIPKSDIIEQELMAFESKQNKVTGNVTYGNNSKNAAHDDIAMAIIHAAWCVHEELDGGYTTFG